MRWQRLSIIVRLFCGMLGLAAPLVLLAIYFAPPGADLSNLGWAFMGGLGFAFAAITGKFPDTSAEMDEAVYVRVERNRFRVQRLGSGKDVSYPVVPAFTTERLLVGQFSIAEALLKRAFREAFGTSSFRPSPQVLIQPLDMLEGGLSQVEERVLTELALGAGASKVLVWVGPELQEDEVRIKLIKKKRAI